MEISQINSNFLMLGHLGDLIFITYRFGVHQCWQYSAPVLVVLILIHTCTNNLTSSVTT